MYNEENGAVIQNMSAKPAKEIYERYKTMGKRCSLCGGKLNGKQVCRECGLDNSKNDSGYHVRYQERSGPGSRSIEEIQRELRGQKIPTGNVDTSIYPAGRIRKPQKKKKGGLIAAGIVIIVVIIILIVVWLVSLEAEQEEGGIFWSGGEEEEYSYEPYDPYDWVDMELPKEGGEAEYSLPQGTYVVGVHIPAGNYEAETEDPYDWVQVTDWENGIFLFEYEDKPDGNYLDDLRLFDGALVEIGDYGPVKLKTSNAQTSDMHGIANPLTESFEISGSREWRAGKDFPAGVYDAELTEYFGMAEVTVYYENEEEDTKRYYFDSEKGIYCRNIVIPEGAKLSCDEEMRLRLTPSEVIETTDYLEYYKVHEGR